MTSSKPDKIDYAKLLSKTYEIASVTFSDKESILYALGIGFNLDPLRSEDFKYTNEFDTDFVTFPTIASCLASQKMFEPLFLNDNLPQFGIHQILHAEEKIYMVHQKLSVGKEYNLTLKFIDAFEKGKNAFIISRIYGYEVTAKGKSLAFYIDRNIFIRGLGKAGFKGTGESKPIPEAPKRNPDIVLNEKTFPNQAFFYRLNGDSNPLHIDPKIAALAGFEKPIIHGLATYGITAKSIMQSCLGNDPTRIKSYETRFIGHVYPGESLKINIWKEADKLLFLVETVERNTKAVSGMLTIRETAKL